MWLQGVVVRRYIDFLILHIPTPLVSVLFAAVYIYSDCEQVNNLNCNSTTFFVPNSTSKSL